MTARYAIYLAPEPDTLVWRFGTSWLGRDPETGPCAVARLGLAAAYHAKITATPARYGFHGTLKPPFRLAEDASCEELVAALERFAAGYPSFEAPSLVLGELDGFLALVPAGPAPALGELAAACVTGFDGFRAPLTQADIARRNPDRLTSAQRKNLTNWGYPHVLDDFRYHMTLTGRLDEAEIARVRPLLEAASDPLRGLRLQVGSVALYHEPAPGADFRLVRRFPLSGRGKGVLEGC